MKLLVALVLAGLCNFGWLVEGIKIEEPDAFSAERRHKYRNSKPMVAAFEQIETELRQLVQTDDADANVEAAKKIEQLKKKKWTLFLSSEQRSFGQALELLVALQANNCDLTGYETLAKIKLIVESGEAQQPSSLERIRSILNEFCRRHAEKCRPVYKAKYRELLAKISDENLKRLKSALGWRTLELIIVDLETRQMVDQLGGYSESLKVIALPRIDLYKGALNRIAKSINTYMSTDLHTGKPIPVDRIAALTRYLFMPCAKLDKHLGKILVAARFDAAFEDEQQVPFLTKDKEFTDAMAAQRLCTFLLDHQAAAIKSLYDEITIPMDSA